MDPEKNGLPPYSAVADSPPVITNWRRRPGFRRRSRGLRLFALACLAFIVYAQWRQMPFKQGTSDSGMTAHGLSAKRLQEDLATCAKLHTKPVDPIGLGRERNARYVDGHKATLIKNATVWVGEPVEGTTAEEAWAGKGFSWVTADVFLEHGLIKQVGQDIALHALPKDILVYDAAGRPLTSGIIDMHSHAGVSSLPSLWGNEDTNEMASDITPYVRSIDGIQPGDHQIQVIKSGGVTTSLVLPGSANNIGGEAFVIKQAVGRSDGRNETSATDMLADPDRNWRYMKHAAGENAKRLYGKPGEHGPTSRLGESWEFRHAFEQAAKLLREQDDWCDAAAMGLDSVKTYLPAEIRWESLIAVLRGQVHVNVHCYTIPDLEAYVDHTNEFKFKVRAFHHAHETYLVPEILKRAWGEDPPASALFADNMWYKAESYLGSEYAGKHLHDSGLVPIYVSDNPVLNAQHVVFEAAKGYKYGLPYHAALASVTTAPAERLGLGQRLGKVKPGFDADVVVWDSDPLSVGAAPAQVWIDGTAQFEDPVELNKSFEGTMVPDEDLAKIVEEPVTVSDAVMFTGVAKILLPVDVDGFAADGKTFNVAVSGGKITCVGRCGAELAAAASKPKEGAVTRLKNGYLTSAFTAFGSTLGLNAIDAEAETDNGASANVFSRGIDGLALDTKKLHVSHRYGVTRAISAPRSSGAGTHHGTSVGFLTGAATVLEKGAVFAEDAAAHYTLDSSAKRADGTPTSSAAVGALRKRLLRAVASQVEAGAGAGPEKDDRFSEAAFLQKVVAGDMTLAITAHSADTIAAVLRVKADVEDALAAAAAAARGRPSQTIRLVIIGGAEAHLVAVELAAAGVGVVLAPLLSYATAWDQRRALTGAPLTNGTAVDVLVRAGVVTAIGLNEDWVVRDLGLLAGVAYRNGGGVIGERQAVDLVGRNVYEMLGLLRGKGAEERHFIIHEGSPLEINSRVKAVGDGTGAVDIF